MKSIWKWVLVLLVGLVVVAGLVGLGYVFYTHRMMNVAYRVSVDAPNPQATPGGPTIEKFPGQFRRGPFRAGPRIQVQRFGRFGPGFGHFGIGMMFFGLLGRLVPLAILLLLLYIAYQLGKGRATAPVTVAPAPVAPAAEPVIPTHVCPECGNAVQGDWKHCPHCGKELTN